MHASYKLHDNYTLDGKQKLLSKHKGFWDEKGYLHFEELSLLFHTFQNWRLDRNVFFLNRLQYAPLLTISMYPQRQYKKYTQAHQMKHAHDFVLPNYKLHRDQLFLLTQLIELNLLNYHNEDIREFYFLHVDLGKDDRYA